MEIETPELVAFSYSIAGVGSRAMAGIIDMLVLTAGIVGVLLLWPLVARWVPAGALRWLGAWTSAAIILGGFAFFWGYFVLLEVFWDGQTVGKHALHIRVVRDGGYSITFAASAIRNLMRVVDFLPSFYAVGAVSIILTKQGKRLGDLAAGTIVVRERLVALPTVAPMAGEAGGAQSHAPAVSALLTEGEYSLLDRFLARRKALDPARAKAMQEQLSTRFEKQLEAVSGRGLSQLLALHQREREARAAGVSARGETGAGREQHAIVARGAARWSAFATRVRGLRRRGLKSLSEPEVREFAAEYRAVTTDLARLRTAARGRVLDSEFYLSRLVAAAHNLFYRHARLTPRAVAEFVGHTIPAEVRRSGLPIALSAVLLFAPGAVAYQATVHDRALARRILGDGMIARAEDGARRARAGHAEYINVDELMRPTMASSVIGNNVTVSFMVFAGGITGGVLTARELAKNGVMLGAGLGLYRNYGIIDQMLTFVASHGVLELTAITIAGGAGFLIASAVLLPGALTRKQALVARGKRAITLVCCTALFLAVAGTLEGLVSPDPDIPHAAKAAISVATALLIVLYLSLGGRGAPTTRRAP